MTVTNAIAGAPAPAAAPGPAAAVAPVTPGNPLSEIAAMEADPAVMRALTDKGHPQHAELRDKRRRLFEAAYPEPGADGAKGEGGADKPAGDAPGGQAAALVDVILRDAVSGEPVPGLDEQGHVLLARQNQELAGGWLAQLGGTPEDARFLTQAYNATRPGKLAFTSESCMDDLRGVHGAAADEVLAAAKRAVASVKDPLVVEFLELSGMGNNPHLITRLAELARRKGL